MNLLRKFIFIFILLNFCVNCSTTNTENTLSGPSININGPSDKYNILLIYELNKLTKNYVNENEYSLTVEIKYESKNVLDIRGSDSLNEIEGTVSFKLISLKTNKLIKKGNATKKINSGSITSLYGKDENENHIKERLTKSLSKKIYNKIKLYLN